MTDIYNLHNVIQIFSDGTPEREKLKLLAEYLNDMNSQYHANTSDFYVHDTWFDYGAEIQWTTIVARDTKLDLEFQIFYPLDLAEVLNCESDEEIQNFAEQYLQKRQNEIEGKNKNKDKTL